MTKKEILNTPEIVDFMIDKSVILESKMKLHKRLDELCKLAIKALEQEPCEDCISRQAVIDCFKKWQPYMATRLHEFENELFELPSVNPQKIGWIPVSERLPEEDGEYLLFGKVVEDDMEDIFIGMYDACAEKFGYMQEYYDRNTLGFLDSELIEYNKVIAWQPKPKPYKEESEE